MRRSEYAAAGGLMSYRANLPPSRRCPTAACWWHGRRDLLGRAVAGEAPSGTMITAYSAAIQGVADVAGFRGSDLCRSCPIIRRSRSYQCRSSQGYNCRLLLRSTRRGRLLRPHLMAEVLPQFSGVLHFFTRMVPSITLSSSVTAT